MVLVRVRTDAHGRLIETKLRERFRWSDARFEQQHALAKQLELARRAAEQETAKAARLRDAQLARNQQAIIRKQHELSLERARKHAHDDNAKAAEQERVRALWETETSLRNLYGTAVRTIAGSAIQSVHAHVQSGPRNGILPMDAQGMEDCFSLTSKDMAGPRILSFPGGASSVPHLSPHALPQPKLRAAAALQRVNSASCVRVNSAPDRIWPRRPQSGRPWSTRETRRLAARREYTRASSATTLREAVAGRAHSMSSISHLNRLSDGWLGEMPAAQGSAPLCNGSYVHDHDVSPVAVMEQDDNSLTSCQKEPEGMRIDVLRRQHQLDAAERISTAARQEWAEQAIADEGARVAIMAIRSAIERSTTTEKRRPYA